MLLQTLKSLINQSFKDFEIIVGNDYVKEPLTKKSLCLHDSRLRIINHKKNLGELENMNFLLNKAKGKYFIWIFDDDPCSTSLLRIAEKNIKKFNFPLVIYPSFKRIFGCENIKFNSHPNETGVSLSGREFINSFLIKKIKVLGCCGFYNLKYLQEIGGVQKLSKSRYALHSEYLLIMKSGILNDVIYIPEPLLVTRSHSNSWSSNNKDLRYFMEAGHNLLNEAFNIFSHATLKSDFSENMSEITNFILGSIVVKIIETDSSFCNKKFDFFVRRTEKTILAKNDKNFGSETSHILKQFARTIFIYRIKGYIKNYLNSDRFNNIKSLMRS